MAAPDRVLFAGDTHGDSEHVDYLCMMAAAERCSVVFILGDFGYWEHSDHGAFLDDCSNSAERHGVEIYWLDGNHENHTWLRERYIGTEFVERNDDGLVQIREHLWHAPRAHRWNWHGLTFMALGGAYSIDKEGRLVREDRNRKRLVELQKIIESDAKSINARQHAMWELTSYSDMLPLIEQGEHTMWWPEEEISDGEVEEAIAGGPVDVLLTHDKPLQSEPGWNRKNDDVSKVNQRRVSRVVSACQPRILLHGHLHYRYTDVIRSGDNDRTTVVEGLDCNPGGHPNKVRSGEYDPRSSWAVVRVKESADLVHGVTSS